MELYLMQHGSCLSKEIDPDQPLSPVGREQVLLSAAAARAMGLVFDRIVTSPKTRARQTAQAVAETLGMDEDAILVSEDVKAMARPEAAVRLLAELDAQSVLVTGHLPHLAELASHLLATTEKVRIAIQNGGLMRLDCPTLPTHSAELRWYLTPLQLQIIAGRA